MYIRHQKHYGRCDIFEVNRAGYRFNNSQPSSMQLLRHTLRLTVVWSTCGKELSLPQLDCHSDSWDTSVMDRDEALGLADIRVVECTTFS